MAKRKPIRVHLKAWMACGVLIAFGMGFSWILPFSFVECTRQDGQVDCRIEQRMLAVIPFRSVVIRDVQDVTRSVEESGTTMSRSRGTEALHACVVTGAAGDRERFLVSRIDEISSSINRFLIDDTTLTYSAWTVPLLGWAAFVVVAPGLLLAIAVTWDFVRSLSSIET